MAIKRYDVEIDYLTPDEPFTSDVPCDNGEWVRYEDHAADIERRYSDMVEQCATRDERIAELEKMLERAHAALKDTGMGMPYVWQERHAQAIGEADHN